MNILVIGNESNAQECRDKFGSSHTYTIAQHQQEAVKYFGGTDVIFDFLVDRNLSQMEAYRDHQKVIAFLNTSLTSLAVLTTAKDRQINCTLFGFCGLPTFLNRELLEVSLSSESDLPELNRICRLLETDFIVVADRVGLVTPRVISMIINEAYYAVQDETATKEDIDIAMKLGTNYPYGPFEWCKKIGIAHVYNLLTAVLEDTMNDRYKICPLLIEENLKQSIQR